MSVKGLKSRLSACIAPQRTWQTMTLTASLGAMREREKCVLVRETAQKRTRTPLCNCQMRLCEPC